MPVAVEIFGFFLTAVGLLMLGVTLAHSSWRVSTVHGNVITTNTIFENLWYSCATDSMGVHNCWEFPSMLALSGTGWGEPKGAEGGGRLERPQGGWVLPVVGPWAPYSQGKPDAVRRPASCSQECWGHLCLELQQRPCHMWPPALACPSVFVATSAGTGSRVTAPAPAVDLLRASGLIK